MIFTLCALILAAGAAWATDRALIDAALSGRAKAMEALVRRLLPVIRARVSWRLRDRPQDVDDFTQQVWVTLLKADGQQLRAYDPERGAALETYVGLVAQREVGNALAKRVALRRGAGRVAADSEGVGRAAEGGASDPQAPTEQRLLARSELQALLTHLDRVLSERQRLVVRLAWMDGYSAPEIAQALNTQTQTVYNDQHRIRRAVAAWMAEQQAPVTAG